VEKKTPDDLRQALEGRGFATDGATAVSLDALLPIPAETDAQWLLKRAATEISNDRGLRFLRAGAAVLPEPAPGEAPGPEGLASAVSGLKQLLGDNLVDPMVATLREVEGRGRVGAVVTRLEVSPDVSEVRVESTLLVRMGKDRWVPALSRSSTVRPSTLAPNAGAPLADDPQVKAAFGVVESLGLGPIPEDVKQRSLSVGAATQKALGQVRSALVDELSKNALPIHEVGPEPAGAQRRP
jgi:hypothetical protein